MSRPQMEWPFRMPLYPLPPIVATAGFLFMLSRRANAVGGLAVAVGIALSGSLIYVVRARKRGEWPFAGRESSN